MVIDKNYRLVLSYILIISAGIVFFSYQNVPKYFWSIIAILGAILLIQKYSYIDNKNKKLVSILSDIVFIIICDFLAWIIPNDTGLLKNFIIGTILVIYLYIILNLLGWYKKK